MSDKHRFIKASASSDIHRMAAHVIKEYYSDTLAKIKPRIDFLFCYAAVDEAGNPKGPAIMLHGHPAYATIQVTALMHRALGEGDVLIKVDGEAWKELPDPQKEALLDHELYHLNPEMVAGEENFKLDDLDRPKFKMREHDIQVGWFTAIAARHGAASIEVIQALSIKKKSGQLLFDFEGAADVEVTDLIPAGA